MKALSRLLTILTIFSALGAFADDPPAPPLSAKAEKYISEALPICSVATKVERVGLAHPLPSNLTGAVIRVSSDRATCAGQYFAIESKQGGFFAGIPIFLDNAEGNTFEERIKDYGWRNSQMSFAGSIDKKKPHDGLFTATLTQITDAGKLPVEGAVDADGKLFFFGTFLPMTSSYSEERLKALAPLVSTSPTTGSATPKVTVIEFSDFECPSCKGAAHYLKPILEKYGSDVKYVRYDLPLVATHPWAFSAAVAGRAIYHQKPALFWDYKEQIYKNQDSLTAFSIDDFTRNFAQDHDLNMKQYEADINSQEIRAELLKGVGLAYGNAVLATPTYIVNGRTVDPGNDGKALEAYVAGLLKK